MGFFRANADSTQFIDNSKIEGGCCGGNSQCNIQANDEDIREIAYFRWLTATGGNPVSEEESQRFWFEAQTEASKKS
jgi:hypothetical protein